MEEKKCEVKIIRGKKINTIKISYFSDGNIFGISNAVVQNILEENNIIAPIIVNTNVEKDDSYKNKYNITIQYKNVEIELSEAEEKNIKKILEILTYKKYDLIYDKESNKWTVLFKVKKDQEENYPKRQEQIEKFIKNILIIEIKIEVKFEFID